MLTPKLLADSHGLWLKPASCPTNNNIKSNLMLFPDRVPGLLGM